MITLEEAIETSKFGFNIDCDADKHSIQFSTNCNHCGEYFSSKTIDVYCKKCNGHIHDKF